ncbi:MAG TPA: DUF624 domain-containing protein [Lachnospiraceae bacterium]|nr:DUF624 domain-containing protein [Lachnospiraceae bacterium]
MNNILNPESKVLQFVTMIANSALLNFLWFLCSIPIFTIGASTTALFSVTLKMVKNEEGSVISQYFRAFKENFKSATKVWLILLAAGLFLAADGYVLFHIWNSSPAWTLLTAAYFIVLAGYAITLMYVFPLMARFSNTTPATIRNAFMIGMRALLCTALMAGIYFLMALVAVRFFTPILFFGFGLCALICSKLLDGILNILAERAGIPGGNTDGNAS